MEEPRYPAALLGYGYSMRAAAIASALVERQDAHIDRRKVREWLDRIKHAGYAKDGNLEEGRVFAECLTNLARVGCSLKAVDG